MKAKMMNKGSDAASRIQENVKNLPFTSMAMAGLLGAGTVALLSVLKPFQRNNL